MMRAITRVVPTGEMVGGVLDGVAYGAVGSHGDHV